MLTDAEMGTVADSILSKEPGYDPATETQMHEWLVDSLKKMEAAFESCGYQLVKK